MLLPDAQSGGNPVHIGDAVKDVMADVARRSGRAILHGSIAIDLEKLRVVVFQYDLEDIGVATRRFMDVAAQTGQVPKIEDGRGLNVRARRCFLALISAVIA